MRVTTLLCLLGFAFGTDGPSIGEEVRLATRRVSSAARIESPPTQDKRVAVRGRGARLRDMVKPARQPGVSAALSTDLPPPHIVRPPAAARRASAATVRRTGHVPCAIFQAPRPRHAAVREAAVAIPQAKRRELAGITVARDIPYAPALSNDLAAVEIFGTLDDWKAVKWALRVHIVACADANGQHKSTMTKAQMQQAVELAAKVFEPAQIRILFDPAKDWEEVQDTKLNRWDDPSAAAFAAKPALRGKIVLFSSWGPNAAPNNWAANGGTHIWLGTGGGDASGICHELGHLLGLPHTFPGDGNQLIYGDLSQVTAANVDSVIANFIYDPNRNKSGFTNEQAMDGDGFSDTPPDPGNDLWEKKFGSWTSCDSAHPTATVPDPKGGPAWVFTPDRTNLESYFFRCPAVPTITGQQAAAILGRVEGTVPQKDNQNLRRLIEGQTPFATSSGQIVLVGKVQNVGTQTSSGGRTAILENASDGQPLGPPESIGPLAPAKWLYVKVPMPGGTSWTGTARLRISPGDENPANDTLTPKPYKAPVVK